jgi:hypothetical protein
MKTRLRTLLSLGVATTAFTLAGGDHAAEGAGKATAYVQSYDQSTPRESAEHGRESGLLGPGRLGDVRVLHAAADREVAVEPPLSR